MSLMSDLGAAVKAKLALKANLASPTFTGTVVMPSTTSIGTVSNTEISYLDGVTSNIQTALNGKQASLGFTPVQNGTGVGQLNNTVKIGWSGSRIKATVDATDMGNILTTANVTLSGTTLTINL